ncbi:uncharacterized protein LOC129943128 [Eupeodes corollae]|uniref:uncharacterized protein LOC129943128 n=1 Tax=Eupeodes corollae TaxID=290404 RepID=UPI00248FA63A|nr:uncharacterized protein LOC129943128 [Eupeodes corollae]
MDVNARYGGSAYDSFVWRQNEERATLERNYLSEGRSSWLLGDSGYPLEPFLLTPYRNASEDSRELNFNFIHSQARSIVERCIGRLKSRWRIILEERKLRYKPIRVVEVINVCAALHNICCTRNVPHPKPERNIPQNHGLQVPAAGDNSWSTAAKRIRDGIRDDLYANN